MQRNQASIRKAALLTFGLAACGTPAIESVEIETTSATPLNERLLAIQDDLLPGSVGEGVRAIHDYLTAYGYFPNGTLAGAYPAWRPIVPTAPPRRDVYGEQTTKAIRALQRNSGLAVTGIVDKETLALMQKPRCGVPDGISRPDPSAKFARSGSRWPGPFLFWKVTNTDGDVSLTDAREAARLAFARWQAQTDLAFLQWSQGWNGYNIGITFAPLVQNPGALAEAASPADGGDITLNPDVNWSVAQPTPPGFVDLQMLITHEIGHALGLRHSAFFNAVMAPGPSVRDLFVDDMIGISSIYDSWTTVPGAGMDIGANATGAVWVLGTGAPGQADFPVYQWNGSDWDWDRANGWGTRITVDRDGRPWVVNSVGDVYRRSNTSAFSGVWEYVESPLAIDIAAEGGNVWIVSNRPEGNDFRLYQQWGSRWISGGAGRRIGIGSSGFPWMVDSAGSIFRRTSPSASEGWWEQMPGAGNDISVGPFENAFVVGTSSVPGVGSVHLWNEQWGVEDVPDVADWINLFQDGTAVAVGQNGRPWMIGPNHEILTVTK